jgi:hypothetical protein
MPVSVKTQQRGPDRQEPARSRIPYRNAQGPSPVPEPSPSPERFVLAQGFEASGGVAPKEATMHSIIYLIGLIVVIMAILSLFGLR